MDGAVSSFIGLLLTPLTQSQQVPVCLVILLWSSLVRSVQFLRRTSALYWKIGTFLVFFLTVVLIIIVFTKQISCVLARMVVGNTVVLSFFCLFFRTLTHPFERISTPFQLFSWAAPVQDHAMDCVRAEDTSSSHLGYEDHVPGQVASRSLRNMYLPEQNLIYYVSWKYSFRLTFRIMVKTCPKVLDKNIPCQWWKPFMNFHS